MLKMGFSLKPGWCSPDDPGSFLDFLAAIGVDAVELTLSSSGAFERKVAEVALARGLTITLHIAWDSEASWDWYRGWNIVHVPALYHQPRRTAVIKRGHAVMTVFCSHHLRHLKDGSKGAALAGEALIHRGDLFHPLGHRGVEHHLSGAIGGAAAGTAKAPKRPLSPRFAGGVAAFHRLRQRAGHGRVYPALAVRCPIRRDR